MNSRRDMADRGLALTSGLGGIGELTASALDIEQYNCKSLLPPYVLLMRPANATYKGLRSMPILRSVCSSVELLGFKAPL